MRALLKTALILSILAILTLAPGCGGGTSGTGIQTYEGNVRSSNSDPLTGVTVRLIETGASAITDSKGDFVLTSEPTTGPVTLELTSESINTSVTVKGVGEEDLHIAVEIMVNTDTNAAEINNYSANVGIVGACDIYFENNDEVIRQANQVPIGTRCTLKIHVYGDGIPSSNIPIGLQRSACPEAAPWETIGETITGVGVNSGVAQLTFRYADTRRSCRYRILVPFGVEGKKPLKFYISTFTEQEANRK